MRIKIGIDLDNVLNNLNEKWIEIYNKDNNDNLKINDIKSWDIHKYTKNGKNIYKYLNDDLFKNLKPLPYAVDVTKKLQKHFDIFVVTASFPDNIKTKMDWLKKYYPHIKYENVIICQRKDLINVDILIDDSTKNLISFPRKKIALKYEWNKDLPNSIIRVKNWIEIYNILNKFI